MASLSATSIRRPVLTLVINLAIVLFGVVGYQYLGVREFPIVEPPVVSVQATYVGANPTVIESQVTEPLEESLNGIPGIRSISSTSAEGRASISVEFELGIDIDVAANDVRDRVSRAANNLPEDMDPPTINKADANFSPVVIMSVQSSEFNALDLSRFSNDFYKERLQTIPGVAEVRIWGEKRYAMRLWLDPGKLAAYRLTPLDVQAALQRENVELPTGRIEGDRTELSIRTLGRLRSEADFNRMVIREAGGQVVRLEDIGYAQLAPENMRVLATRDGLPANQIALVPQPDANTLAIAEEFYRRVDAIARDKPAHVTTTILFDTTRFIRQAIDEVIETLIVAFVLVVAVIFLFLRDWRSTLIPVLAIPVSLIGAFFLMYALQFSVNVLTLLALVLAIGLVVDDAIVVLENIYKKIEDGEEPIRAGLRGSKEIYVAVIATTVVICAVFLPIIFLQGIVGRLFFEFGVVLAGAVVISTVVALTLTPMLSSRLLKVQAKKPWFYRVTEPFFERLTQGYAQSLNAFLRRRWLAWAVVAGSAVGIVGLYRLLPSELAPLEDRGNMRVIATGPEGATYEYMRGYMRYLEQYMLDSVPERQGFISVTSPSFGTSSANSGFVYLVLTEASERTRSQNEIAQKIQRDVAANSAARVFVSQPQSIADNRGGLPVQYVIQAPSFDSLANYLPLFLDKAGQHPAFSRVDVDLKFTRPELTVEIDREKARSLNVSTLDIARTVQLGYSGARYGFFLIDGKQYPIIGELARRDRNDPADLRALYVRSQNGELIQLDNLIRTSEIATPPQRYRYNRFASATVSADLSPGYALGQGIEAMNEVRDEILPEGFTTALSGTSRNFAESTNSLQYAFVLALVMIYLVLAAQFESWRDPLIIIFTVPLALFGALLVLWYFRQTLNIFSQIGIVMLIGLVTKNGILIVEFATQLKNTGLTRRRAASRAAEERFRPILMTSLSTVLGFLPIALALGAGAESRVSMGIAVVGGVLLSTGLTLYVIPALYTYLASRTLRQEITDDDTEGPAAQPVPPAVPTLEPQAA
ncbi:MAG: efflux RND transporter permease subunit [Bacteroidia bacterium]|nr:efflux RND transporter permease subunit [Bacteroidia bacterium]